MVGYPSALSLLDSTGPDELEVLGGCGISAGVYVVCAVSGAVGARVATDDAPASLHGLLEAFSAAFEGSFLGTIAGTEVALGAAFVGVVDSLFVAGPVDSEPEDLPSDLGADGMFEVTAAMFTP
jgi:hypothetical protein